MRQRLSVLIALVMGAGLLVGMTAAPSSAASPAIAVRSTVAAPWPGEVTKLTGRVTPKGRVVQLQRYNGKRWVRVKSVKTRARGTFTFSVRASTTRIGYRVVAPKKKIKRKTYPKRQSKVRYVKPVKTSINLSLTPGVIRVSPVRTGSQVVIQRRVGSKWKNVRAAKLPASGLIEFADLGSQDYFRAAVRAPRSNRWLYSAPVRSTWKVDWKDEFTDAKAFGATWTHRDVGIRQGMRQCTTTSASNSYITGGVMRLRLTADANAPANIKAKCKNGTFFNAMVGTQTSKNAFTRGVFAARVKFQAPQGMHGGFWMQTPGSPEIDIAEYFGDGRSDGGLASFLHPNKGGSSVGGIQRTAKTLLTHGRNTPSTGYHVYSVERTASSYIFRVDGVPTLRTSALRSNDPHFIMLSLLASDWELTKLNRSKLSSAYMDVDWVRTWS